MLTRLLIVSVAFIGVVVSQTVIVTNSEVTDDASTGGKIIRPNVTITSSQRRVYVPKGKSLKFGDSPILKLSFQPSAKLSKALSFSEPKSSQFFHLIPSTPTPNQPESTSLAPPAPTKMRSVHRISNTTYQMPADFLCEGLDCPKGEFFFLVFWKDAASTPRRGSAEIIFCDCLVRDVIWVSRRFCANWIVC